MIEPIPQITTDVYTTLSDYQYAIEQAIRAFLLGELPIHFVADCYRVDKGDMLLVIEGHLTPWQIPDREDWADSSCVPINADIQAAMLRFAQQFEDGADRMMIGLGVSGAVIGAWLGRRCNGYLTSQQYRRLSTLVKIMGYRPIALAPESVRAIPVYAAADVVRFLPRTVDALPVGWVGVASPIPDLMAIQWSATSHGYSAILAGTVLICSFEETPRFVGHVAGTDKLVTGIRSDGMMMVWDHGPKSPIDWVMGSHVIAIGDSPPSRIISSPDNGTGDHSLGIS